MRILKLIILAVVAGALLAGCTSNRWRAEEAGAYYEAQSQAVQNQKPLFELKAQPGQTIELKGIQELVVNDPRQREVRPMPENPHPIWGILGKTLDVGAKVYGVKLVTDGAVDIVKAVGNSAGDHSVTTITDSYDTDQSQHYGDDAVLGDGNTIGDGNGDGDRFGGDYVGRDSIGGNVGDNQGENSGNSGRIDSPGPIDESVNDSQNDNSDNSDGGGDDGDDESGPGS